MAGKPQRMMDSARIRCPSSSSPRPFPSSSSSPLFSSSSSSFSFFRLSGVAFVVLLCGLFFAAGPSMVEAQTCEPFAQQPSICVAAVPVGPTSTVYVQPNTTQAGVAAAVQQTINQAVAFPTACQAALAELSCLTSFFVCEFLTPSPPFPPVVPKPACRSVCDAVINECSAAFAYAGISAALPNCSMTANGLPVFPEKSWVFAPGVEVNCSVSVTDLSLIFTEPVCAPHYAPNPYEDVPLACLPECPLPYYNDDQWDALWYLYALFGILTIVVAIFVLPPYFLSPSKWHWPQQMNMWIMFCSAMLGLGNSAPLVFYGNNWRDVVCKNAVSASGQTDSALCTFQAVFQIYWGFAGILWWLFLVAKAALLVNGFKTHMWAEMICAHAYCWGVPFISLTMLLANGKVGSGSPPICNYLVAGAGDDGWWIQSVLLIPEAIVLLIGCCFMTALLYTLIKYEGFKGLRKKGRLLTYLICFLIPNVYLEIFYYVSKTHDNREVDIARWLTCLATNYATGPCEDILTAPNYPAQVVNVLLVASVIFSYMLIFGLKLSVFQWWWALIKGIFTCDFKNFSHWWTDISTSQTSRSTSAAS